MPLQHRDTGQMDATDRAIVRLYVDHRYADIEIARVLGIHRTTVTRRRLALGVTRRDRRAPGSAVEPGHPA